MSAPPPDIVVYHLPPAGAPRESAAAERLENCLQDIRDYFYQKLSWEADENVPEPDAAGAVTNLTIAMTRADIITRTGADIPNSTGYAEALGQRRAYLNELSWRRAALGSPATELDQRMDSMIAALRRTERPSGGTDMEGTLRRVEVAARRAVLAERLRDPSPVEVPEHSDPDLERDTERWFFDQVDAIESAQRGDVGKTIAMLNHNHLPHRVVDVRTVSPVIQARFRGGGEHPMVATSMGHEWRGYEPDRIRQVATEVHGPDLFSGDEPRRRSATETARASFNEARFAAHRATTRLPASSPQARSGPSGPTAQGRPTSLGR